MVTIVANEELWFVERLERNMSLVVKTRAHTESGWSHGAPLWFGKVHAGSFVNQIVSLPVGRLERHALGISFKDSRTAARAWDTEWTANFPHDISFVIATGHSCHLSTVTHVTNEMRCLIKLKSSTSSGLESGIFELSEILRVFLLWGWFLSGGCFLSDLRFLLGFLLHLFRYRLHLCHLRLLRRGSCHLLGLLFGLFLSCLSLSGLFFYLRLRRVCTCQIVQPYLGTHIKEDICKVGRRYGQGEVQRG